MDIAKSLANEIWHPQIIFSKAQDIVKNKGYGYNDFFQFQIWPYVQGGSNSKFLMKSEILSAKFPCNFEFHSYPFDRQVCKIPFYEIWYPFNFRFGLNRISSITYGEHNIKFENQTIRINSSRFPFKINITISPAYIIMVRTFKNIASFEIVLERDTLQLLMGSFYIPTEIFAILSIGSYVINPEVVSNWTILLCKVIRKQINFDLGSRKNGITCHNIFDCLERLWINWCSAKSRFQYGRSLDYRSPMQYSYGYFGVFVCSCPAEARNQIQKIAKGDQRHWLYFLHLQHFLLYNL